MTRLGARNQVTQQEVSCCLDSCQQHGVGVYVCVCAGGH